MFITVLIGRHAGNLTAASLGLLTKIEASADRMSVLIRDVLDFSMASNVDRKFEKVDLDLIIREILDDFDLLLVEKGAIIKHEKLPVIEAIPLQMGQLFYNLIGNALKFTRLGITPAISVTYKMADEAEIARYPLLDQRLTYSIIGFRDNGIGFEQEYAEQIFHVFKRLHGTTSFSGTGIGLALCRTIVENHGGMITATSRKDEGALFSVVVPIDRHAGPKGEGPKEAPGTVATT